jgi:hypothetical protein
LFGEFLTKFKIYFLFSKNSNDLFQGENYAKQYYTWVDQPYREFMLMVLKSLEPRFEKKSTVLKDELDEADEVLFVVKGSVVIGYEVNKVKKYCIRQKNNSVVGAFMVTFNQRSEFVYTALSNIEGFFVRK